MESEHPRSVGGSANGRQTSSRRVRDLVNAGMRSGTFDEHNPLVEETLIDVLGASRSAVRNALQNLADQGMVIRKPRTGTFPSQRAIQLRIGDVVGADAERYSLEIIDQRRVPTFELLRMILKTDEEEIRMVENTFLFDREVIGVRTAYFRDSFTATEYSGPIDMTSVAHDFFGVSDVDATTTEIGATLADSHTGRLLGVGIGYPLLTRQQTFKDRSGEPVQVVFDHYRGNQVTFFDGVLPPRPA